MQDFTFDDFDYTLCTNCHSSVQPYNNISITTINISMTQLASINPFTKILLHHKFLHCSKCGLYIKIHPKSNDQTSIQKIFICSNNTNNTNNTNIAPHKYCLCYHCGLLYGINPNQKSIDILNIIKQKQQQQEKQQKQQNKIANSIKKPEISVIPKESNEQFEDSNNFEREVIDDNDQNCSESDDEQKDNKSKIDESYLHLIALQTKLNLLSNISDNDKSNKSNKSNRSNKSCPSSPNISKILRNKTWNISNSLRGSPLLGPSTPSPRVIGKDVDESEKKWQQYLLNTHTNTHTLNKDSTNVKLEKQQKKLEELQKLQKELSVQKKNSEQFARLFRNGIYSKETVNKMTNFRFEI